MKLQHVHLRIQDADTGQALPCRVRVTDADGKYHAPLGRLARFPTLPGVDVGGSVVIAGEAWAMLDGACEILLPPGDIRVRAVHGLEHVPVDETLPLVSGKLSLRLPMRRWAKHSGYHFGDARAHYLSPAAAGLEAVAQQLDVVELLAFQKSGPLDSGENAPRYPALLEFSGQEFAWKKPGAGVAVNTLNRRPGLGARARLCTHRPVYPLTFGGPGDNNWTLDDWCDQGHRKQGMVVWAETARTATAVGDGPSVDPDLRFGEPIANLIQGKIDAFELTPEHADSPAMLDDWYLLLNAGFRLPIVGASGKTSNARPLGSLRTAAEGIGDDYRSWIESCRQGKTFVTQGPLVSFHVNGMTPGLQACSASSKDTVFLQASAESAFRFDVIELVHDGRVLAEACAISDGGTWRADRTLETSFGASGWLAARCRGGDAGFAHTSPIFLRVDNRPMTPKADAMAVVRQELENILAWSARQEDPDRQLRRLAHIIELAQKKLGAV